MPNYQKTIYTENVTAPEQIKQVSFKDMRIDELPLVLEVLYNLTHLTLWNTQINDISMLCGLTNLTYLDLDSTGVADLSPVQGLSNLEFLFLRNTPVSDLTALKGLTKIERLLLSGTRVTDISPLQGLAKLTLLTLPRAVQIDQVEALKQANPLLTVQMF